MSTEAFQIPLAAAEIYEERFVPALFAEWAPLLVSAAEVRPGHAVLDVACGTGVVAREAADRIGTDGIVVGVDLNGAMLTVARRLRPDIEWQQADVVNLPFPERAFDVVLCQMALMFFPDRVRALREMVRVVARDGRVGIVVPAAIGDQPAYRLLADVVRAHAGEEATLMLDTYWSCGDLPRLLGWFNSAGLRVESVRTHTGTARFPSADALVTTEVEASPLAEHLTEQVYRRIRTDAADALARFAAADGTLHAPLRGHLVVAGVAG